MSTDAYVSSPREFRICAVAELPDEEDVAGFLAGDIEVAVFNVDGEFAATVNTCSHEWSPLTDGYVEGAVVECAFHGARFDIRSGRALCLPASRPLAVCQLRISGDDVYVTLPAVEDLPRGGR